MEVVRCAASFLTRPFRSKTSRGDAESYARKEKKKKAKKRDKNKIEEIHEKKETTTSTEGKHEIQNKREGEDIRDKREEGLGKKETGNKTQKITVKKEPPKILSMIPCEQYNHETKNNSNIINKREGRQDYLETQNNGNIKNSSKDQKHKFKTKENSKENLCLALKPKKEAKNKESSNSDSISKNELKENSSKTCDTRSPDLIAHCQEKSKSATKINEVDDDREEKKAKESASKETENKRHKRIKKIEQEEKISIDQGNLRTQNIENIKKNSKDQKQGYEKKEERKKNLFQRFCLRLKLNKGTKNKESSNSDSISKKDLKENSSETCDTRSPDMVAHCQEKSKSPTKNNEVDDDREEKKAKESVSKEKENKTQKSTVKKEPPKILLMLPCEQYNHETKNNSNIINKREGRQDNLETQNNENIKNNSKDQKQKFKTKENSKENLCPRLKLNKGTKNKESSNSDSISKNELKENSSKTCDTRSPDKIAHCQEKSKSATKINEVDDDREEKKAKESVSKEKENKTQKITVKKEPPKILLMIPCEQYNHETKNNSNIINKREGRQDNLETQNNENIKNNSKDQKQKFKTKENSKENLCLRLKLNKGTKNKESSNSDSISKNELKENSSKTCDTRSPDKIAHCQEKSKSATKINEVDDDREEKKAKESVSKEKENKTQNITVKKEPPKILLMIPCEQYNHETKNNSNIINKREGRQDNLETQNNENIKNYSKDQKQKFKTKENSKENLCPRLKLNKGTKNKESSNSDSISKNELKENSSKTCDTRSPDKIAHCQEKSKSPTKNNALDDDRGEKKAKQSVNKETENKRPKRIKKIEQEEKISIDQGNLRTQNIENIKTNSQDQKHGYEKKEERKKNRFQRLCLRRKLNKVTKNKEQLISEDSQKTICEKEFIEFCFKTQQFTSPELIAEGTFGLVYKCQDTRLKKPVVVKVGEKNEVNLNELRVNMAISELNGGHENIVKLLTVDQSPGCVFLVYEYFPMSLLEYIESRQEVISAHEVKCILKQILNGLTTLHGLGYLHGDLKTENIVIRRDRRNKIPCVKIIDLGGATLVKPGCAHIFITTVCIQAPENAFVLPSDFKVDVWALGCIAAEMILREYLFSPEGEERCFQIVTLLGYPNLEYVEKSQYFGYIFCKNNGKIKLIRESFDDFPYKKISDITKSVHGIWYNDDLNYFHQVLTRALQFEPEKRATAQGLLQLPFFQY